MNNTITTFDTLEYANELKAGGVPDKQAETQAKALARVTSATLATKQDLKEIKNEILFKLGGFITVGLTILGGFITVGLTILGYVLHK